MTSIPPPATAATRRHPPPASKSSDMAAAIPRIVLGDDRAAGSAGDPPPPTTTTTTTATATAAVATANGPALRMGGAGKGPRPVSGADSPEPVDYQYEYVPHRCNSDIGLPTASMPNLPLAMALGEHGGEGGGGGGGGDTLGVYCSPRTTRRSVDLDVAGSRAGGGCDPAVRAEYEWLAEDRASSLRVLSAGSRVGSAVSLNSVCTAHSVGLLSNDSDSDDMQDSSSASFLPHPHDSSGGGGFSLPHALPGERAGQLRRLQSYPETAADDTAGVVGGGGGGEGGGSGEPAGSVGVAPPRTSHSLCNLKAAQATPSPPDEDGAGQGQGRGQLTPEKLCLLPSDLDECEDVTMELPPDEVGGAGAEGSGRQDGAPRRVAFEVEGQKSHMVSYGKGSNSMREGRIRRWLQDMDKATE